MRTGKALFSLLLGIILVLLLQAPVRADDTLEWDVQWEGVSCIFNYGSEEGGTPPSCEGLVLVFDKTAELGNNMCEWMPSYFYDCETGARFDTIIQNDPNIAPVEGVCSPGQASKPCGRLVYRDGITWESEGEESTCSRWRWDLRVHASFPCNRLAIYPYPSTTVGWPTAFKFLGGTPVTAQAGRAYAGAGSPGAPREGDQRNIVLQLRLIPARNALELYIPRWGRVVNAGESCPLRSTMVLPAQNEWARPIGWACWDLPSHPEAGGGGAAGAYFPDDPVGWDAPLFRGIARLPYLAYWHLSYEEYKKRTYCDTSYVKWDWNEQEQQWEPECTTADGTPGHEETEYYWDTISQGGPIDPDWIPGFPDALKADLNGDGDPEAFWSYNIRVVRMDENGRLQGWWEKEYPCRREVPIVVREAQSRIAWPRTGQQVEP